MNIETEVYKNRVIRSVYNKMESERDAALADMTAILENPTMGAQGDLEAVLSYLLHANMQLSQLETLFGAVEADKESCEGEPGEEKKCCDKQLKK